MRGSKRWPAPEDVLAATNSLLEAHITATDSDGVRTTVVREIQPKKIRVSLESNRDPTPVTVNGTTFQSHAYMTSWAGWQLTISVPPRRDLLYRFRRWHDNVTANPRSVAPTEDTGYKAFYELSLF